MKDAESTGKAKSERQNSGQQAKHTLVSYLVSWCFKPSHKAHTYFKSEYNCKDYVSVNKWIVLDSHQKWSHFCIRATPVRAKTADRSSAPRNGQTDVWYKILSFSTKNLFLTPPGGYAWIPKAQLFMPFGFHTLELNWQWQSDVRFRAVCPFESGDFDVLMVQNISKKRLIRHKT